MKAQICRKNSHLIHLIHVCFDWLTFLNISFWCNIFQMQPRWKTYKQLYGQICTICLHTLQPIYNLWISALYVLHHSVFHTSTGFSIKLVIPHVLPLLLPLIPGQLHEHCSSILPRYRESIRKGQRVQRFIPPSHEKTDISTKGHTPDLGK